jgi:putative membrane protein
LNFISYFWGLFGWLKSIPRGWLIWPIVFVAGAVGSVFESTRDFFTLFTFPVLGSGAVWVLWTSRPFASEGTWIALVLCYILGFISECLGVATGWIFGPYDYGLLLGPKFWGVPPLIGLNWVILVWGAYSICSMRGKAWLAALGVVFMDIVMEPGATRLGFWTWQHNPDPGVLWSAIMVAPLQNYCAWGILAWLMLGIMGWPYRGSSAVRPSESAIFYTANMVLYFVILWIGEWIFP